MTNAPADMAKALREALPNLDYNKLVAEARRQFGVVLVGETEQIERLLTILRDGGTVPSDVKAAIWHHVPGKNAPVALGKTELAIVLPATEEHMQQARSQFGGVAVLPVLLPGVAAAEGLTNPVSLAALDAEQVRRVLVPEVVDRLQERWLALGRALPATRDRIAGQLIRRATRDPKLILGTVAGAASGRSGALTPATAALLIHQAVLIVSLAAIYGADLDDRRGVFARVAPHLAPTLLLDGAEAVASRLAADLGKDRRYGKWYGPAAAYALRPTFSTSSTLLAGLVARRVFRGGTGRPSVVARTAARTRALGKRALAGASQATEMIPMLALRRRRPEPEAAQEEELPRAAEAPAKAPPPAEEQSMELDEVRAAEHAEPDA
jgi:hypothetical protein